MANTNSILETSPVTAGWRDMEGGQPHDVGEGTRYLYSFLVTRSTDTLC